MSGVGEAFRYSETGLASSRVALFLASSFVTLLMFFPATIAGMTFRNNVILPFFILLALCFLLFLPRIHVKAMIIFALACGFGLLFGTITLLKVDRLQIIDLIEAFKPIASALFFLVAFSLSGRIDHTKFMRFLLGIVLLSIIISFTVFVEPLRFLSDIWKMRGELTLHYTRFVGFLGYLIIFGLWMCFFSVHALLLFIDNRRAVHLGTFIVFVTCLFLTGSRTAFIVFLLCMASISLIFVRRVFSTKAVFPLFFILGAGVFLASKGWVGEVQAINYLRVGLENISGSTFGHRERELRMLRDLFTDGFLLGHGPSNEILSEFHPTVETAYFYFGFKFGLVGLMYFLALIMMSVALFFRVFRVWRVAPQVLAFAVFSFWALTVGGLSTAISENFKTVVFFPFVFGIMWGHPALYRKGYSSR